MLSVLPKEMAVAIAVGDMNPITGKLMVKLQSQSEVWFVIGIAGHFRANFLRRHLGMGHSNLERGTRKPQDILLSLPKWLAITKKRKE